MLVLIDKTVSCRYFKIFSCNFIHGRHNCFLGYVWSFQHLKFWWIFKILLTLTPDVLFLIHLVIFMNMDLPYLHWKNKWIPFSFLEKILFWGEKCERIHINFSACLFRVRERSLVVNFDFICGNICYFSDLTHKTQLLWSSYNLATSLLFLYCCYFLTTWLNLPPFKILRLWLSFSSSRV